MADAYASEAWSRFFGVADILATSLDQATGTITAQLGDVAGNQADSSKAEIWTAPGLASRPALADGGKAACQGFYIRHGSVDTIFALRDVRANAVYGNLEPGATALYACGGGQAREMVRTDGSVRQMTTDSNTQAGNLVFAGVSSYYTKLDGTRALGGEWRTYGSWGGQWQDPTGYHLRTWHGVKVDAGGFVMPSPISATVSKYRVSADLVNLDASVVSLGRGTFDSLVKATSLQTIMSTLATSLTKLAVQLGSAGSSLSSASDPKVVAAGGVLTTAAGTLTAAIAALGTVQTAAGTTTVTGA